MRRSRKPLTGLPRSGVQTERQRARCAVRRRRTEQPGAQRRASVPEGRAVNPSLVQPAGLRRVIFRVRRRVPLDVVFYGEVAERLNAAVSKTVNGLAPFGGSDRK